MYKDMYLCIYIYIIYYISYIIYHILYIIYYILHIIYYLLFILYYTLYNMYYILYLSSKSGCLGYGVMDIYRVHPLIHVWLDSPRSRHSWGNPLLAAQCQSQPRLFATYRTAMSTRGRAGSRCGEKCWELQAVDRNCY